MSKTHLAAGSEPPPEKDEGKLRLYSMEFCPYAQRTRLVLLAKNIPHEIVNINLINKPEWYFKVHPEGKVPALDTGSKVIVESLDISDFLDQEYPDPPLYPAEPEARRKDKELIESIAPLTGALYKLLASPDSKSAEEWSKELTPQLDVFEKELEKRGTVFFYGDRPGMVDYMLWPWAERSGAVKLVFKEPLFGDDAYPKLRAWRKAMKTQPAVKGTYNGPEKFYKVLQAKIQNQPVDYDNV